MLDKVRKLHYGSKETREPDCGQCANWASLRRRQVRVCANCENFKPKEPEGPFIVFMVGAATWTIRYEPDNAFLMEAKSQAAAKAVCKRLNRLWAKSE